MPTYDYLCDACDHKFEEWQSFHDAELTKCPKCKKKKLRRLIGGGAAIIFKGSGFYETDYRSESYKSAEKAETPKTDAKDDTPKSDTKAETPVVEAKPAAKPKSKAKTDGKK